LAVLPDRRFADADTLARAVRRASRPAADAAARLQTRVRALMKTERPLQALDRLIIAEFADSSSEPLPTGTGERPRLTLLRGGGARRETDEPDTLPHHTSLASADSFDDIATSPRHFPLLVMPSARVEKLATPDPQALLREPTRAELARALLRRVRRIHVVAALLAAIALCTLRLLTHSAAQRKPQNDPQTATQNEPQSNPQTTAQTKRQSAPQTNTQNKPQTTDQTKLQTTDQTKPQSNAQSSTPVILSPPTAPAPKTEPAPTLEMPPEPVTLTPDSSPASAPRKPRVTAPVARGFLTLDSEPWATVYLGARKLGTTPFAHVPLPAGRAQLTLDLENSGRRRPLTVKIAPSAETRLTVRPR